MNLEATLDENLKTSIKIFGFEWQIFILKWYDITDYFPSNAIVYIIGNNFQIFKDEDAECV